MKEGGWGSFSLTERNQLTWEKWQKGKQLKGGSEKVESRNLEEGKNKGQPSKTPLEWESQLEAFEEGTLKEENNEEWGRDQPSMLLTQHWFWYPGEQMGGINGTLETLGWHYKRSGSQQWRALSNSELDGKDPWENPVRIQKKKKERKNRSGSSSSH